MQKLTIFCLLLILLISAAFRLWKIQNQFEVWDEVAVVRNGELYLNFLKSGDFSDDSWSLNKEHPPFSKYFYGVTRIVSLNVGVFRDKFGQEYPIGRRYTFQRMVSAGVGVLSVLVVFKIASLFYDRRIALLSAGIFGLIPYTIAHSRVATQENLVLFLTSLSVYFFLKALKSENLKSKNYIISAIVLGFAISTKYNAFFLLPLFAITFLIYNYREIIKSPSKLIRNYLIWVPLISLDILYVMWPWLWKDPVNRFISSANRVNYSRFLEYFLGQYPSPHPWYYFFVYFLATTPPVVLLGISLFFLHLLMRRRKIDAIMSLYFFTPFLALISPLRMDGVRYIFPIFAPMAVLSGVGFGESYKTLTSKFTPRLKKYGFIALSAIIIFILAITNIKYFPYNWDYYNFIFGGPKKVYEDRLFDFAYWGEGVRWSVNYLNANAEENSTVYLWYAPTHVSPLFREDLGVTSTYDPLLSPDYIIRNATGEWLNPEVAYDMSNYKKVYEKALDGAPIIEVFKREK